MATVRQSSVSESNSKFWPNSPPSVQRRRSAVTGSTISSPSPVVSPKRQRRSATKGLQKSGQSKVSSGKNQSPKAQSDYLNVPVVPTAEALPIWLLRLCRVHRYSSIVTFLLVAVALVVYGWTVYSQEQWNQDFRRLQNLQRNERQLTTTNAMLKNKMAEEAERPSAGLVSPTPDKTIFLPSASDNANSMSTPLSPTQGSTSSPLGY